MERSIRDLKKVRKLIKGITERDEEDVEEKSYSEAVIEREERTPSTRETEKKDILTPPRVAQEEIKLEPKEKGVDKFKFEGVNIKAKQTENTLSKEVKQVKIPTAKFALKRKKLEESSYENIPLKLSEVDVPKPIKTELEYKQITERKLKEKIAVKPKPIKIVAPKIEGRFIKPEEREKWGEKAEKEGISSEEVEAKALESIPELLEFLFGRGVSKLLNEKALCIVLPKDFEDYARMVAGICREVYKEKKGKLPKAVNEWEIGEVEKYFADVEGQIVIVESTIRNLTEHLKKILRGFYSKGLGYLILISDEPWNLADEVRSISTEMRWHVVELEPRKLEIKEKESLLSFVSGRNKRLEMEGLTIETPFGRQFLDTLEVFEETLKSYLNHSYQPVFVRKNRNRILQKSPYESDEANKVHSGMKAFVAISKWKESGKREEEFEVKFETDESFDVEIGNERYEVETFYGRDPLGVLTKKVNEKGEQINFVLRNISVLLHLKDLLKFKRDWRETRIYCLDLEREKLIEIGSKEFKEKLFGPFKVIKETS